MISIHAPLAGRDIFDLKMENQSLKFQSTRPSRGATFFSREQIFDVCIFQSTRPSRGATETVSVARVHADHFNPRAPRGARRLAENRVGHGESISIHAPLAGRDGHGGFP